MIVHLTADHAKDAEVTVSPGRNGSAVKVQNTIAEGYSPADPHPNPEGMAAGNKLAGSVWQVEDSLHCKGGSTALEDNSLHPALQLGLSLLTGRSSVAVWRSEREVRW
jgi:hypothetical protein